jgi:ATP-binding cassette subfamily B protein
LVLAVAGLIPAVVRGTGSAAGLSLALGGVLLAFAALHTLVEALTRLADAAIAFRALAPLVRAGATPPAVAPPGLSLSPPSQAAPVASARGLVYRAPRRAEAVLADCDLRIERGAHVLLEGASGAGKSTLGALLAGLRTAETGLVLAGGLDRASLGETGWRRRVSCAPQFHDNHLFTGSLAFNLLMGRSWPPSAADLAEASAVCADLGLGPVIERMPAGLFEMVGETGWQLSQGERSRVFLARALLQHAELVVLDESLAALDPATLELAIACIERRAKTALVIAHP